MTKSCAEVGKAIKSNISIKLSTAFLSILAPFSLFPVFSELEEGKALAAMRHTKRVKEASAINSSIGVIWVGPLLSFMKQSSLTQIRF
jgi:hypothetical protein